MSFQITNYHNKKSTQKALAKGEKIKLFITPLSRAQELANRKAELENNEPQHVLPVPKPYEVYEILSFRNKQTPAWTATVRLNCNCEIVEIK